ncbi:MAG: hypothetical protein DLM69_02205 [Candidatus Chloroheliales bacterium]|nr:MAG: hypothetical protein DLM69_02205 [Chloroflexota bacterium]
MAVAQQTFSQEVAEESPGRDTLQSINIKNVLSFGPEGIGPHGLELRPLNILIGDNGGGKSNFLDVLQLLRAAALGFLPAHIAASGGVRNWRWRGNSAEQASSIEVSVRSAANDSGLKLRYSLSFIEEETFGLKIIDEKLDGTETESGHNYDHTYLEYRDGHPYLVAREAGRKLGKLTKNANFNPQSNETALAQMRYFPEYGNVVSIGFLFDSSRFYLDWDFGRNAAVRRYANIDERAFMPHKGVLSLPGRGSGLLSEDAGNLAAVLDFLRDEQRNPGLRQKIRDYLREFYIYADDIEIEEIGSPPDALRLVLHETNLPNPTPVSRMSEGTLQWLALLAVLLDPNPAPLICLEEPEVNLHPDAIHLLARLLKEASRRSQIIVTTHSDYLLEEFTRSPEDVVVVGRRKGATTMKRLDREELASLLKKYTLSQLWDRGFIGGNK